jgi:RNase P subunit RPR2
MKQRLCPRCNSMIIREVSSDGKLNKVYIRYKCHNCNYRSLTTISQEEFEKTLIINLKDPTS